MMKGMLKRALGVVAATAMAATGIAGLTGTANAATAVTTPDQSIMFTADDQNQLEGHTVTVYRIAEYMDYGTDPGTGNKVYGVHTIADWNTIRTAINQAVEPNVSDDGDPLAEAMSQTTGDGSLDTSLTAPYTGTTRTFVNALEGNLMNNGTSYTFGNGTDGTIQVQDNGEDCSATITGLLPGIYVIYDTTANGTNKSVGMMIGTAPVYQESNTTVIVMKNQSQPDMPGKEIVDGEGNTAEATVSIGDTVTFKVTGRNVQDPSAYPDEADYTYQFVDTPGTGLLVPEDSDIRINGTAISGMSGVTGPNNLPLTGNGGTPFTVTLDKQTVKSLYGAAKKEGKLHEDGTFDIVLTYTAKVTGIDSEGNIHNTAQVVNNGNASLKTNYTAYTGGFEFTKKNAAATRPLSGAIFQVKQGNSALWFVKQTDGSYLKAESTTQNATQDLTTVDDGLIKVAGLADGNYTVVETKSPTGYMDLDLTFTVTVTVNANGKSQHINSEFWGLTDDGNKVVKNVENVSQLPKTGAAGITAFIVLGLLIAGVGVTVYMKSRNVRRMMRA